KNNNLYTADQATGRNVEVITAEDTQTMRQIIVLVPANSVDSIYEQYTDPIVIYRKIIEVYEQEVSAGNIDKETLIDQKRLESLKEALAP
ncbi:hypothetical protein GN156_29935, partial [bacterium LRH843]|nr:hypothetical protein [bacterium LRH843]